MMSAKRNNYITNNIFLLMRHTLGSFKDIYASNLGHKEINTTLYSNCNQASDLSQQLELASELEFDLRNMVDWGRKWLVDFNAEKTHNADANDVKMDGFVLEEKSFLRCWG